MNPRENKHNVTCVSCGETVTGKFCGNCGEKVLNPHDRTIGHFFHEFFHVLTHADGKFLKSLKLLFTRPGFLTNEHIAGKRKKYTSPLSLFLIANLLYLLIPATDALNSHYTPQMKGQPYSAFIQNTAVKKMQEKKWTELQMEERYDQKTDKLSKVMLILLVLLFSIPVTLLFYNKDRYYADHLTFATEFMNFLILGLLWILPWSLYLILLFLWKVFHVAPPAYDNISLLMLLLCLVVIQLPIAAHRVYRQPWYFILPKALVLTLSFAVCVVAYRFILFHVVIWML